MIDQRWVNEYGMIKARQSGAGEGNIPLYTAITIGLLRLLRVKMLSLRRFGDAMQIEVELDQWSEALPKTMSQYEIKPGLTRRTPTDPGQETWDNHLGWIALSVILDRPEIARRIFWYGVKHFGFYDTDGKLSIDDAIWNPHLWCVMTAAAFPILRSFFVFPMKLMARFLNADHPGGVMLDWLWFETAFLMGVDDKKFVLRTRQLPDALKNQLGSDHPAVMLAEQLI